MLFTILAIIYLILLFPYLFMSMGAMLKLFLSVCSCRCFNGRRKPGPAHQRAEIPIERPYKSCSDLPNTYRNQYLQDDTPVRRWRSEAYKISGNLPDNFEEIPLTEPTGYDPSSTGNRGSCYTIVESTLQTGEGSIHDLTAGNDMFSATPTSSNFRGSSFRDSFNSKAPLLDSSATSQHGYARNETDPPVVNETGIRVEHEEEQESSDQINGDMHLIWMMMKAGDNDVKEIYEKLTSDAFRNKIDNVLFKPIDVRYTSFTTEKVHFEWDCPQGRYDGFKVQVPQYTGKCIPEILPSADEGTTMASTVENIKPGTEVNISVVTYQGERLSEPAELLVMTEPAKPTLQYTTIDQTDIKFKLINPIETKNGQILNQNYGNFSYFDLKMSDSRGERIYPEQKQKDEDPNILSVDQLIDNLIPGTWYNLELRTVKDCMAMTKKPNNVQYYIESVAFKGCISTAPGPVEKVEIIENETECNSFRILWTRPSKGGLSGYIINIENCDDVQDKYEKPIASENSLPTFTIDGRRPGNKYDVFVKAYMNLDKKDVLHKYNPNRDNFHLTAPQKISGPKAGAYVVTKPSNVDQLQLKTENDTSLTLSWKNPSDGRVDSFVLQCNLESRSDMVTYIPRLDDLNMEPNGNIEYTAENLRAGEMYKIQLYSKSYNITSSKPAVSRFSTQPKKVKNLKQTEKSTTSLRVAWQRPEESRVEKYVVRHRPHYPNEGMTDFATNELTNKEELSETITEFLIPNLKPGTKYDIVVTAKSHGKESEHQVINLVTTPNAPKIQDETSTTTKITLNLKEPDFKDEEVQEYETKVFLDNEEVFSPINIEDVQKNTAIMCTDIVKDLNFDPGRLYQFQITAKSNGESSEATVNDIPTIPLQVKDIQLGDITVSSANVIWTDPNHEVDHYEVWCHKSGEESPKPDWITVPKASQSFKNLESGYGYTYHIVAVSNDKRSQSSSGNFFTVPSSISSIEIIQDPETSGELEIKWDRPNGGINKYRVELVNESDGTHKVDETKNTYYDYNHLTPGEEYNFEIIVMSNGKESTQFTKAITLHPAKPGEIKFGTATAKTLKFHWKESRGTVEKYEGVYYPHGEVARQKPFDTVNNDFELKGLEPGTPYDVEVKAIVGDLSSSISKDYDYTLPSEPGPLYDLSSSNDTIKCRWSTPNEGNRSGYRVKCSPEDKKVTTLDSSTSEYTDKLEHIFHKLIPGAKYRIHLATVIQYQKNGKAEEKISELIDAICQTEPPIPVVDENTSLQSITCTDCTVSWHIPQAESKINGTIIKCSTTNGKVVFNAGVRRKSLPQNQKQSFKILGLTPGTKYEIILETASFNLESNSSVPFKFQTVPAKLKAIGVKKELSLTSIVLNLEADPMGYFDQIQVYTKGNFQKPINEVFNRGSNAVLEDLISGTTYPISARPVCVNDRKNILGDPIEFRFTTKPQKPVIDHVDTTTDSITISWKSAPGHEEIDKYKIEVNDDQGKSIDKYTVGGQINSKNISGDLIKSGLKYLINIIAISKYQESESACATTVTDPNPCRTPEDDITASETNATLQWYGPDVGGKEYFQVRWYLEGSEELQIEKSKWHETKDTSFNASDLKPGSNYHYEIRTWSMGKRSQITKKSFATVPSKVHNLDITVTCKTADVKWKKPTGNVCQYLITCNSCNTKFTFKEEETVSSSSYSFKGLVPGVKYRIEVTSESNGKTSLPCSGSFTTVPEKLSSITEIKKGKTSAKLKVKPGSGQVDKFIIEIWPNTEYGQKWSPPQQSQSEFEFKKLESGTWYNLHAFAIVEGPEAKNHQIRSEPFEYKFLTVPLPPLFNIKPIAKETGISFTWTPQSNNWTDFETRCFVKGSEEDCKWISSKKKVEAAYDNLKLGVIYLCQVRTVVDEKEYSEVIEQICLTYPKTPEIVESETEDSIDCTSVTLKWHNEAFSEKTFVHINVFADGKVLDVKGPKMTQAKEGKRTFSELKPGKEYDYEIFSKCEDKTSKIRRGKFQMRPSIPSKDASKATRADTNKAVLYWLKGDGEVDKYRLRFSDREEYTNNTFAEVTNLTPGKSYNILISACKGSKYSDELQISFVTDPEEPLWMTDVSEPVILENGLFKLVLTWEQIHSFFDEFILRYQQGEERFGPLTLDPNNLEQEVNDLIPGATYVFYISTTNGNKKSTEAKKSIVLAPAPPTNLKQIDTDSDNKNSLNLSWMPPKAKGLFDNYKIEYRPSIQGGTTITEFFEPQSKEDVVKCKLQGLTPGTKYECTVKTMHGNHESTVIDINKCFAYTDPDCPGPIECTSFGTDEIEISWPPADPNIDKYVIECNGKQYETTNLTYRLEDLQSGTQYKVMLRSKCNGRFSKLKQEKTIYTKPKKPIHKDPEADPSKPTYIKVKWGHEAAKLVDHFEVLYGEPDKVLTKVQTPKNDLECELTLKEKVDYIFKVIAVRNKIESEETPITATRDLPMPQNISLHQKKLYGNQLVKIMPESDGSYLLQDPKAQFVLKWDKVDFHADYSSNGNYHIYYTEDGKKKEAKTAITQYALPIRPGCSYSFNLTAVGHNKSKVLAESRETEPININVVPDIPTELNVSEKTISEIDINWSPPNEGKAKTYQVDIKDFQTNEIKSTAKDLTKCQFKTSKLKQGHTYQVCISATLRNLLSKPAKTIIHTRPGQPKISDVTMTTSQITVKWDEPNEGAVTEYFCYISGRNEPWRTPYDTKEITFTGLQSATTYKIAIYAAYKESEYGKPCQESVETAPDKPGFINTQVSTDYSNVKFTWHSPRGTISKYSIKIYLKKERDEIRTEAVSEKAEYKLNYRDLEPMSRYVFKVAAVLKDGKKGEETSSEFYSRPEKISEKSIKLKDEYSCDRLVLKASWEKNDSRLFFETSFSTDKMKTNVELKNGEANRRYDTCIPNGSTIAYFKIRPVYHDIYGEETSIPYTLLLPKPKLPKINSGTDKVELTFQSLPNTNSKYKILYWKCNCQYNDCNESNPEKIPKYKNADKIPLKELQDGTKYYAEVSAGYQPDRWGPSATFAFYTKPLPPLIWEESRSHNSIKISWSKFERNSFKYHLRYWSTSFMHKLFSKTEVDCSSLTSFTCYDLNEGNEYAFEMMAKDTDCGESGWNNLTKITTYKKETIPTIAPIVRQTSIRALPSPDGDGDEPFEDANEAVNITPPIQDRDPLGGVITSQKQLVKPTETTFPVYPDGNNGGAAAAAPLAEPSPEPNLMDIDERPPEKLDPTKQLLSLRPPGQPVPMKQEQASSEANKPVVSASGSTGTSAGQKARARSPAGAAKGAKKGQSKNDRSSSKSKRK